MYRTRFERLEPRKMFSVTDWIIDPIPIQSLVGDFNGDGRDDVAEIHAISAEASNLDAGSIASRFLPPYMEQDNLYKLSAGGGQLPDSLVQIVAQTSIRQGAGGVEFVDGTSNTMMISEVAAPINVDLLGALANRASMDLSVVSVDVREHASSVNRPDTNGIIAILIGLAVDPHEPSGDASGVNFGLADGSVRHAAVSLVASDEYFAQFSDTALDDARLIATTFGRGTAPLNLTHDIEFEKRADAIVPDSTSSSARFYDLLISSILHEDNDFSFPRMLTGSVRVA